MAEIKQPTCGRIVHYFPGKYDPLCSANGATKVPAIVVQEFGGLLANLSVFPMSPDATNVLRYSVRHKSVLPVGATPEMADTAPYWDWPEIK